MRIRSAKASDRAAVTALLSASELPLAGVPADLAHFVVAEDGDTVVGAIGLEPYGDAALLRSAVVASEARGTGVGERLVKALLAQAREAGTRELILLTTTAETWFPRFGFEKVERGSIPPALHASEEFKGACPATATAMRLKLS